MIMNIAVIVLVLSIAYAWMVRGAFSAMLHMLCAFIAGAVAFAFWEPLALMLVKMSPERGFFSFIEGIAWGVALIVPFAIAFLLLRAASDKLIPNNIKNATVVDYAGGAVFGAITGVISIGILVIGIGNMRVSTNFLGYQPIWYSADRTNAAGSLVRTDSLWVPADKLVAQIYGNLSKGTMSTSEPLAYWYPELELTGFASRVSPGDGAARNALRPSDFNITRSYTVGNENGSDQVSELLKFDGDASQRYRDINEEAVTTGQIFGYVVQFEAGAKERGEKGAGQLVISNGQVRLLIEDESTGETQTVFPNAVISESSKSGQFGRWRFDAEGVFITSTGGGSKVPMGFEFVVPQGSTPVSLYIKNVRVPADELPEATNYASVSSRDQRVRTGSILKGDTATKTYEGEYAITYNPEDFDDNYIRVNTALMEMVGSVAAKRNFTVDDDNQIVGGQGSFDTKTETGRSNVPVSKNLRVERYAINNDQSMVVLDVGSESPFGLLGEASRTAPLDQPIKLIDTNGNEYEAIGFQYKDREIMELRYTRGSVLAGINDTPTLSTTRTDQELLLVFIVTKGVDINQYVIGDTLIARFTPPMEAN